jgi:hypothetical protein
VNPTGIAYKNAATASLPSATYQNEVYGKPANDVDSSATYPAFQFARGLTIAGLSDWYIPAKNELAILFNNLGPSFTTATAFQTSGTEAFSTANDYWSSTESSSNTANAWSQYFLSGTQSTTGGTKASAFYARAVRRVAA